MTKKTNTVVSPLDLVKTRMEAHNKHDIELLLACYADDVIVYNYPDTALGRPGKKHIRDIFEPLFANKAVHAEVHYQAAVGNHVINHETVEREGKLTVYIAIYEIVDGLIQSVRFIRQPITEEYSL